MNALNQFPNTIKRLALLLCAVSFAAVADAQVVISSVVPADGATNVPVNSSVVFTFSQPMNTSLTFAMFTEESSQTNVFLLNTWSGGNTILTCSSLPGSTLPDDSTISWDFPYAISALGMPLSGATSGSFSTGAGGGGSANTNRTTTVLAAKFYMYHQESAATPVLDTNAPYSFQAHVSLASNRTANAISLTLPNSAVSNLTQIPYGAPWDWSLFYYTTNESTFTNTLPNGLYTFNVQSTTNQLITNNLPATMLQPNAPQVTNYAAAQAVDPSKAFTLGWNAFQSGTTADYIAVRVGDAWGSPDLTMPGALNGTARSVQIPAGALQPNSNYNAAIVFYRYTFTSNASYVTTSYKATYTDFNLSTLAGTTPVMVFTNPVYAGGSFAFDLNCPTGQVLTIQYTTNVGLGPWNNLLTTNPTVPRIHISDTRAATNKFLFYRAKTGT